MLWKIFLECRLQIYTSFFRHQTDNYEVYVFGWPDVLIMHFVLPQRTLMVYGW